jgi:hypothetical protein
MGEEVNRDALNPRTLGVIRIFFFTYDYDHSQKMSQKRDHFVFTYIMVHA